MTETHGQTTHAERYEFSPTSHPVIAQQIYTCREDGNLVIDLQKHDEEHERMDRLFALLEPAVLVDPAPEEVTSSQSTSKKPSSTGRNIVKVTEP